MRLARPLLAHALSLSLIASALVTHRCEAQAGSSKPYVRDSAGVRIVELTESPLPAVPQWRPVGEPLLTIGDRAAPGHELNRVKDALRLADGRVVVANGRPMELRVFSSTGELVKTLGRAGSGPGEFRNLTGIQLLAGDSILVFDPALRRVSLFSAATGFLSSTQIATSRGTAATAGLTGIVGRLEDGTVIATGRAAPENAAGYQAPLQPIVRLNPALDSGAIVDQVHYTDMFIGRPPSGGLDVRVPSFGPRTTYLVDRNWWYIARSDAYGIRRFDRSGRMDLAIRFAWPARSLTDIDVRATQDSVLRAQGRTDPSHIKADMDHYRSAPRFQTVVADAEHNLWVRQSGPSGSTRSEWIVFRSDGSIAAQAELPDGASVLAARAGLVVVNQPAADGTDRIIVYRIGGK